jgi:2-C-methyl-D-erythritol 4-phosphate cytidylyltransferase
MKTERNVAVIVASGLGKRMNAETPKQFLEMAGRPILAWSIDCFEKCDLIDEIIVVVPESYLAYTSQSVIDDYGFRKINRIIAGGITRQESVLAGLLACPQITKAVAIHDGVRPFVRISLIGELFSAAKKTGAAIPAVKAKETVKTVDNDMYCKTLPREQIYLAQTPQVFKYSKILEFHKRAAETGFEATDDAMLAEHFDMQVLVVPGDYDNLKITTPEDLILGQEIAKRW